jgi:hypothetical protein
MRNLFLACAAFGVASTAVLSPVPVQAQVIVRVPGVAIDTGPSWRQQHDGEWRDRREYRESEQRQVRWERDHCVRDWSGHAFCR